MKKVGSIFFLFFYISLFATHNRAGDISYKRIAPYTVFAGGVEVPVFNYSITVTVYTDHGLQIADRCGVMVYFGDGDSSIAYRMNSGIVSCNPSPSCGSSVPCGELIINQADYKVKKNIYTLVHTYSGAGSYLIRMADANRNADVHNMTNSVNQAFYIEALLVIHNLMGANTSPVFTYDPIDRACINKCFYHNPGAYDIDGDSLSFHITASRKSDGSPVNGYFVPETGGGIYEINSVTGLLTWCTPQYVADYNLAFIVKEWRKNTSGVFVLNGYVLRDMQVLVSVCPDNNPPTIILPQDTCVEAGTLILKTIGVTDITPPGVTSTVSLEGNGGAFSVTNPRATLSNTNAAASYTSQFSWQTSCDHIRKQPYLTVFKAKDNGATTAGISSTTSLVSFNTYNIRVIPPTIKNVTAQPLGSKIKVSWSPSSCNPPSNPLVAYKIYRKSNCLPIEMVACQTGILKSSGLTLIGHANASTSFFIDDNKGNGLVVGQNYAYIVVASYNDSTETFASALVCAKLKRNVPVLLNVSVLSTSTAKGSVFVRWTRPLTNKDDLDTVALPGPYTFNLKYRAQASNSLETVFSTTSPYFLNLDTSFIHNDINTATTGAEYQIEFIAGTVNVGSSQLGSSVFLKAEPSDRKIKLTWESNTPWNNYTYTVLRKSSSANVFTAIASTSLSSYTDTMNIVNRYTYCYKVESKGEYSDPSIFKPLINNSQELCATAKDLIAPCSPTVEIDADCAKGFVKLNWTNVKVSCKGSDDVLKYTLFFKPTINEMYQLVDTFYGASSTSFVFDGLSLVSGCYALQAIDSSGNASTMSPDFCLDNCPEFELPNIVTPNGDNANDFFKAVKVRQIKEIDLRIFDRWGNLVYKTNDPYFNWNTVSILTKQPVSEGTFFYICDVYEPRLKGIVKRSIKGYMEVLR